MQKKKFFIILIVLILVILSSVCAIIYFFTDLFKSDKELFYKYVLNKNEMINIAKGVDIDRSNDSYSLNSNVQAIYEYDDTIEKFSNDQIMKNLENNIKSCQNIKDINAKIEAQVDKENKNAAYKIQINKLDKKIINLDVVRNDEKYAIKSDDVAKKYIGIENKDIKDFAKKIELPMADYLPDEFDFDSQKYKELISIDEEEMKHIKEVYSDLLYEKIDENCYSSEKNVEIMCFDEKIMTNKYTLTLNKEQSIDIAVKMLERLRQDSITLNLISTKVKTISKESQYSDIEKISEEILKYIEELNNEQKDTQEYIRINAYQNAGKTVKIEVFIENEEKLNLEYKKENDEEKLFINQNFFKNDSGAIVYDIKTSLSGANNIIIGRKGNSLSIEAELYNIKEIYKTILEETKRKYEEQQNGNDDENAITKIEEDDIKELENIYNTYLNYENQDLLKIGIKIEYIIDDTDLKENNIYLCVCNSKIGAKIKSKKEITYDLEGIEKLTNENCLILNSYTKSQIYSFMELYVSKVENIVKQRMDM